MSELLPCPFCGGEPLITEIGPHSHGMMLGDFKMPDHPGSFTVECPTDVCCAMIADTKLDVVATWNRRPAQAPSAPVAQTDNDWLVQNLVKALGGAAAHGADILEGVDADSKNAFYWPGQGPEGAPTKLEWAAIFDAVRTLKKNYKLDAALSVKAGNYPEIPEGWQLVPKQPTDEMRDAGNVHTLNRGMLFAAWKAMLAAAPTPPTTLKGG